MTLAAILTLAKLIFTFAVGLIAGGKLGKVSTSQADNQAAEAKADDPAGTDDVTDLDNLP